MGNCYTKVAFAVNTDELEREFRIMEWKEVNFDAQPAWVKEGTREVFYAEPVGMQKPSWDERAVRYARREQIVAWSQERFGRTASRSRGRLRDVSSRGLACRCFPWYAGYREVFSVSITNAWRVVVHGKVVCEF